MAITDRLKKILGSLRMRLVIACATLVHSEASVKYLNMMIESVGECAKLRPDLDVHFVFGMSVSDPELLQSVRFPPKHTLLLAPNGVNKKQFENFEVVANHIRDCPDRYNKDKDFLMVIDDDDLLLEIPDCLGSCEVFGGFQWIVGNPQHQSIHQEGLAKVKEWLSDEPGAVPENDFSGYCMRIRHFLSYFFENRPKLLFAVRDMEDIPFMNFIDSLSPEKKTWTPETPFIFRRLKPDGESIWMDNLCESLSSLAREFREAREQ